MGSNFQKQARWYTEHMTVGEARSSDMAVHLGSSLLCYFVEGISPGTLKKSRDSDLRNRNCR